MDTVIVGMSDFDQTFRFLWNLTNFDKTYQNWLEFVKIGQKLVETYQTLMKLVKI